jgi:hypothetical protein
MCAVVQDLYIAAVELRATMLSALRRVSWSSEHHSAAEILIDQLSADQQRAAGLGRPRLTSNSGPHSQAQAMLTAGTELVNTVVAQLLANEDSVAQASRAANHVSQVCPFSSLH